MRKGQEFLFLLFTVCCIACQKEQVVEESIPQKEKVMTAIFLSAGDSLVQGTITLSSPVIGTVSSYQPLFFPYAAVSINGAAGQAVLGYDTITSNYSGHFPAPIQAGQQYQAVVTSRFGEITGATVIPPKVATSLDVKGDSSFNSETGFYDYVFTIKCNVLSEGTSRVRIIPFIVYTDSSRFPLVNYADREPVVTAGKGTAFARQFNSIVGLGGIFPARIEIWVINGDEHYARYVNAASGFNLGEILPGGEPRITYSNMSNRIGVIGSYNLSSVNNINF